MFGPSDLLKNSYLHDGISHIFETIFQNICHSKFDIFSIIAKLMILVKPHRMKALINLWYFQDEIKMKKARYYITLTSKYVILIVHNTNTL